MAAKWPDMTVTERVGSDPNQDYFTAETKVPCGKTITLTQNGYGRDRVRAKVVNNLKANASKHVRTCSNCELG